MVNVLLGCVVLTVFAVGCLGLWFDFERSFRAAQHELDVDALWDEDDESAEAVA